MGDKAMADKAMADTAMADTSRDAGPAAREIRTERLVLLPVDPAMSARIVAGDLSGLTPGAGWPTTDTVDGMRMGLEHPAIGDHEGADEGDGNGWLIALRDGTVIGDCGWKGAPGPDGVVEIGYGLSTAYHRQGYGTEAVVALTEWSLAQPGVRRLAADALLDNTASRRVLEHAGFELTRTDSELAYYERGAGRS